MKVDAATKLFTVCHGLSKIKQLVLIASILKMRLYCSGSAEPGSCRIARTDIFGLPEGFYSCFREEAQPYMHRPG